ncbi:MAG: CPBP family intramembrane glutamic endopeptidase [Spirochaetota bacterium]
MKKWIEAGILFSVLFLPNYIQSINVEAEMFNSPIYNLMLLVYSLPQILLILYIISLKPEIETRRFGTVNLRFKDIALALLIFTGIYFLLLPVSFLLSLLEGKNNSLLYNPIRWQFSETRLIPLVFLSCLSIGYREELFFRSYLLTQFKLSEISMPAGIIISTLLFASGHVYQGLSGFAITGIIGLYFSIIFLKTENLHQIAIAHGLFNFTTLVLSLVRR